MAKMKYRVLLDNYTNIDGVTVFRIQALRSFADVKEGDYGGYIQNANNLEQDGDCWVYNKAVVMDGALVLGDVQVRHNAKVYGTARVSGNVIVRDNARVFSNALVSGNAIVEKYGKVSGVARVYDFAVVGGDSRVYQSARVFGDTKLLGSCVVHGKAVVSGGVYNSEDITGNVSDTNRKQVSTKSDDIYKDIEW